MECKHAQSLIPQYLTDQALPRGTGSVYSGMWRNVPNVMMSWKRIFC